MLFAHTATSTTSFLALVLRLQESQNRFPLTLIEIETVPLGQRGSWFPSLDGKNLILRTLREMQPLLLEPHRTTGLYFHSKRTFGEFEGVTVRISLWQMRPLCTCLVSSLEREFRDPVCTCPAGASEPWQPPSHLLQLEKTDAES